jgi:hypothetical protein
MEMFDRIFERRQDIFIDDITRISDLKNTALSLIEDEFRAHSAVRATEDRYKWMLLLGRPMAVFGIVTSIRGQETIRVHKATISVSEFGEGGGSVSRMWRRDEGIFMS